MSLDILRETYNFPPVYVAENEASWLYTPEMNLSGLPRHDDMENVVCRPAEKSSNTKKTTSLTVFISR